MTSDPGRRRRQEGDQEDAEEHAFTYGSLEARPDDDPVVRRDYAGQHYHFLLEFCHTHPGAHEKKDANWRQEVLFEIGPDGAPLHKPLPHGFEAFLDARTRFGVKVGLENTRALLAHLKIGPNLPPVFIVGGTNGKGTVAAALGEAMSFAGYRPGVYTSPHVERYLERIQVAGADPADDALAAACQDVRAAAEALDGEGVHATYFEVGTALALDVFRRHRAVPLVLEVGMGGRGDAVNALTPTVSIITNVGSDHAEHLGATLAERVREKAGILRPGVPCFTAAQGEALRLLEQEAIRIGAPLVPVLPVDPPTPPEEALLALVRTVLSDPRVVRGLPRLAGLDRTSVRLPRLPARLERWQVKDGPRVLLDVAHNVEALAHLGRVLDDEVIQPDRRTLLVGLLRDKPAEAVVSLAHRRFASVHTTKPASERARDAAALAQALTQDGVVVERHDDDPASALVRALDATPREGLLVIAGSFYLAGAVRPLLRQVARRA